MVKSRSAAIGLAEVAREAGVSTATVSNALNRPEVVAPATRQRVQEAIRRLDFVPNRAAASIRLGTNRLIGLVVPDICNPFYSAIARGVADAADEHGYAVVLCDSKDQIGRERRLMERLSEHRAAGALVVPLSADTKRLARLRRLGARIVLIDRIATEHDGCSVAIDDRVGGRLAMTHLLAVGAERLVLVNGDHHIPQCRDRRQGARDALKLAGMAPEALREYEVASMTVENGYEVGRNLAGEAAGTHLGVFCTNDQLALGVVRGLLDQGVAVPDSAAVVGFGDLAIAVDGPVPLTTVEQPKYALGQGAVAKLLAEISEDEADHRHSSTVFTPVLIHRASGEPNWRQ